MLNFEEIKRKIKENRFLIIGRAGMDIYPHPPGTKTENAKKFVSYLGGSSANIAVAISKYGGKCNLVTCVSDDALGKFALKQLSKYRIKTNYVCKSKKNSRISFAIVETTVKNHQSIIYRNAASDLFMDHKHIKKINFSKFSSLIITGTSLALNPSRLATFSAMKIAKKNRIPIILDLDYRPYTWKSLAESSKIYSKAAKLSDIVVGNDDEFDVMCGKYKQGLNYAKKISKNSAVVIYKMGKKGSITIIKDQILKIGSYNVKTLKPTGAGDAFLGGLIGSLLNSNNLRQSIVDGSAAAAIVVTKVGCSVAMPNLRQLKNFKKIKKIKKFKKKKNAHTAI